MSQTTLKMQIKHHVEKIANWNPQTSKESTPFRYIDLSSIDRDTKEIVETSEILPSEAPSRARQIVQTNDVLVATVRPNLNGVAVVPSILNGATASTGFCVLRPKKDKLDHRFLFHWVKNPLFVGDMVSKATGANYPAVSDKTIKESEIPLPPLEEQKRIAAILDKADGIRRKRQQAMAMADEFLRSVFLDMFGDPVTNPKGWEVKKLDKVAESYDCPHSTPRWTAEGVVCIRTSNLAKGDWDFSEKRFVSEKDYISRSSRCEILPGDIILSREGTIGVAAMVEDDMRLCLGQRLVHLKPKKKYVLSAFLLQCILKLTSPEVVAGGMIGTTAQRINLKYLRSIEIPVPECKLQEKYEIVYKTTKRMLNRTISSDKSDILFSCLESNAFAGKTV